MLVYSWFLLLTLLFILLVMLIVLNVTCQTMHILKSNANSLHANCLGRCLYFGQRNHEISMSSDSYPQTCMIHVLPLTHRDLSNCCYVNFFFESSTFWKISFVWLFRSRCPNSSSNTKGSWIFDSYEYLDLNYLL